MVSIQLAALPSLVTWLGTLEISEIHLHVNVQPKYLVFLFKDMFCFLVSPSLGPCS